MRPNVQTPLGYACEMGQAKVFQFFFFFLLDATCSHSQCLFRNHARILVRRMRCCLARLIRGVTQGASEASYLMMFRIGRCANVNLTLSPSCSHFPVIVDSTPLTCSFTSTCKYSFCAPMSSYPVRDAMVYDYYSLSAVAQQGSFWRCI
jgi:hypothetical protein